MLYMFYFCHKKYCEKDCGWSGTRRAVLRGRHAMLLPTTGLGSCDIVPRDDAERRTAPHGQNVRGSYNVISVSAFIQSVASIFYIVYTDIYLVMMKSELYF